MGAQENLQSLRRCSRIVVLLCIWDNVLDLYMCDVKYFFLVFLFRMLFSPPLRGKNLCRWGREISKRVYDRGKGGENGR